MSSRAPAPPRRPVPPRPAGPRRPPAATYRRRRLTVLLVVTVLGVAALAVGAHRVLRPGTPPMRAAIVAAAESQLGYRTDPPGTYCNKFSAYWGAGTADCGNGDLDEEWCADFAAWAWKQGGALVDYRLAPGHLNAASASFYVWGVDHGTWHPVGSGYVPQPGDVALYGLDPATVTAQHVAVVVGYRTGARGPDVVNGDGDRTGFSVVEAGTDQYRADVAGAAGALSGYVSPIAPAGGPAS